MVTAENELPSSSAYCFISEKTVHCIPIDSLSSDSFPIDNTGKQNDESDFTPDKLYLKNRNLVYRLNNPSLSDLETDSVSSTPLHTQVSSVTNIPAYSRTEDKPCDEDKLSPYTRNGRRPMSRSPSPSAADLKMDSIINNYSTHAIYLPKLIINLSEDLQTNYSELRSLLTKVLPAWTDPSKIEFQKLTGGITNMLLSCKYPSGDCVLIRVYGHGTNLIIDRHREFILQLILNSIDLAPPIFSRFKNGLIYGFLPGRSLEPKDLSSESLYPLIAQQLGNWHHNLDYKLIENGVEKLRNFTKKLKSQTKPSSSFKHATTTKNKKVKKHFISNIWELIEDWINIVPVNPNLISSFNSNLDVSVDESNLKEIITAEFEWLKKVLVNSKSPIVSSHCDLLSGNVIIPEGYDTTTPVVDLPDLSENPVKFIDYEYMLPAPRAFDIANHLAEWQGFDCDRSAIPVPNVNNPTLVKWVKGYLNNNNASTFEVELLIEEISTFYGLPGFYWGIWAIIQSEISNIDFSYSSYGEQRLQEYWDWKVDYLAKAKEAV